MSGKCQKMLQENRAVHSSLTKNEECLNNSGAGSSSVSGQLITALVTGANFLTLHVSWEVG
jgi:hypothetical protein